MLQTVSRELELTEFLNENKPIGLLKVENFGDRGLKM